MQRKKLLQLHILKYKNTKQETSVGHWVQFGDLNDQALYAIGQQTIIKQNHNQLQFRNHQK